MKCSFWKSILGSWLNIKVGLTKSKPASHTEVFRQPIFSNPLILNTTGHPLGMCGCSEGHAVANFCRNPNLGLANKARCGKVAGQEGDPGVTSHPPGSATSVREWTLTLPSEFPCWELESRMDSQIFRARSQGSKLLALKSSLYHWKSIEVWMSKMGFHCPFGHLKDKLWPKQRSGVKLAVWFLTIKRWESTLFPCVQATCDFPLKSSRQGLQLCFRPHHDQRSAQEVMRLQSRGSPNYWNFGTPTWESRDKKPFGCGPHEEAQNIL
jgi:hypothetical protein